MRDNISANISNDQTNENGSILCKQLRWGRKVEEFRENWAPDDGFDVVMVSLYNITCYISFQFILVNPLNF